MANRPDIIIVMTDEERAVPQRAEMYSASPAMKLVVIPYLIAEPDVGPCGS